MARRPCIAIDGPAGSGKSSVARAVAERLGFLYVDSGAMYRAVAWAALQAGVSVDDAAGLAQIARSLRFEWQPAADGIHLWVNGQDIEQAIRTAEVSAASSPASRHPEVRAVLVAHQRAQAAAGGIVMEGRDIQTVVLPDAEVKIFLTASLEERARRRFREMRAQGLEIGWEEVLEAVRVRDERDTQRAVAPLRPADDAVILMTDDLSLEQVVERVLKIIKEVGGYPADEKSEGDLSQTEGSRVPGGGCTSVRSPRSP